MASKIFLKTLILISTLTLTIEAIPQCKFLGEGQWNPVCTPGETDYILRRGLVSDNNRTTAVTLRRCRITEIKLQSFNGLPQLKYLDLSINKIEKLKLGVLDGAKQVTYLNLSYNMLSDFPLGLFDQKPNVDVLDLSNNKIHTLQRGIFDPFSKMKHLDVSSNEILGRNLSRFLFDKTKIIQLMDFSKNYMNGAPDNLLHAYRALDFLNLDRCSLEEVPKFATRENLSTMKHLMLSTNLIIELNDPESFVNLKNLEILNLAENQITSINENVFKPLINLKIIILRSNQIKQLPNSLFTNMVKLQNIDVSYNFIEVIPVNAFRGTRVKNLNISHNKFTYLIDNFVLDLRNSGAGVKKFYFNNNPWQCACLWQTLNQIRALEVQYNSHKYDGKNPVCVTTKEFTCKKHERFNQFYVELYDKLVNKNVNLKID